MFSPGLCRRCSAAGAALNTCKPHEFIRGGGRWLFTPVSCFYGVSEALQLPRCGEQECWLSQGGRGCRQPLFCQRHLFAGAPILLSPGARCGGAQGNKKGLVCMLRFVNSMQRLNCLLERSRWKNMQPCLQSSCVREKGRGLIQADGIPAVGFCLF